MNDILRRRAELSARLDPVAAQRLPSAADVAVRERCVLSLFVVIVGSAVAFFGTGAVSEFADVRPPGEVMGLPGVAALVALVICRRPVRRDLSLSRTILFASGISLVYSLIAVIVWPDSVQGTYWAIILACVIACLTLFARWRTR